MRYTFSGHESFHCKSLWLKKGYDYLKGGKLFNALEAVMELGVGKNMVSSIRFWMKAFQLTENDINTELAYRFFDDGKGLDPFCEDLATLWILHYHLVNSSISSIYQLTYVDFQRERKEFDRLQLQSFLKRKCSVPEQKNVYNENTVKKDIIVLLQNYVTPNNLKQIDHFTSLLIGLNLITELGDGRYRFNEKSLDSIPNEVILYALIDIKGEDKTISFDTIQYLSLLFCMPVTTFLQKLVEIEKNSNGLITYTDNSGIRNIHFNQEVDKFDMLNTYYKAQ